VVVLWTTCGRVARPAQVAEVVMRVVPVCSSLKGNADDSSSGRRGRDERARPVVKPLAIDLFCGLGSGQPEFRLRADFLVEELVTRRTENPNHVGLRVFHFPECALSSVLWAVGEFNDSALAAGLASLGKVRIFTTHSNDNTGVLVFASAVVDLLDRWILAVEGSPRFFSRLPRAIIRAVTSIAVGPIDLKVLPADAAILSVASLVGLLKSPKSSCAGLTSERTVAFVWPFCLEASPAQ
jgi:hypothetical protein